MTPPEQGRWQTKCVGTIIILRAYPATGMLQGAGHSVGQAGGRYLAKGHGAFKPPLYFQSNGFGLIC